MPLAARARRGLSSTTAAAPPAEDDDFATGRPPPTPTPKFLRSLSEFSVSRYRLYFVDDAVCSRCVAADLRFEPPLQVVKYPDPILRARNKRINTFDANLRALADEMFDVMYK
jgi:peptide deformylase